MTGVANQWHGLIEGSSTAARRLRTDIEACARVADAPVLVVGPTGSGKERVAEAIHLASRPEGSPREAFVCANQPTELFEASLFGYERGAFTGAQGPMPGACANAADGSLFLDEIGDAPLHLQPRLLRVLESRRYRPLGARRDRELRARVIAATHVDLPLAVERGSFRRDLFHRLEHIVVQVPGLDERREDIPLLARRLAELCGEPDALAPCALDALATRRWPGHVRELKGVVTRAIAGVRERPILADHLNLGRARREKVDIAETMAWLLHEAGATWADYTRAGDRFVDITVDATDHNVSRAARQLGESREWLRVKLKRRGRDDP